MLRNENISNVLQPWAQEAWNAAVHSAWIADEVAMQGDIADWAMLAEADKQVISGLLRGFTIIEAKVRDYWATVAELFQDVHISAMSAVFSAQETVHQHAYSYLEQTLGLDTYEAFLRDETANAKLSNFARTNNLANDLATFSGAGEFVSLFSSFMLLLSYCKGGEFKGLRQILSWSTRDELAHSLSAIKLFKLYCQSSPAEKPNQQWIADMLETAKQNELAFVANAFAEADAINGLTLQDIELFINHRCNEAATLLGYDIIYKEAKTQPWFDLLTSSNNSSHNDFFAGSRNGSAYSAKLSQDFSLGLAGFASTLRAPQCNLSGQCL